MNDWMTQRVPPARRECLKTNENSYIANKTLTFQSAIQLPQAGAWERGGFWDTLEKGEGLEGVCSNTEVFNENLNLLNNYISKLQNVLDGCGLLANNILIFDHRKFAKNFNEQIRNQK